MESGGETHYVSFLSGEGGGMGSAARRGSRPRSSGSTYTQTARDYLLKKQRGFRGVQGRLQLLVGLSVASLLLCCGLYMWASEGASDAGWGPLGPSQGPPGGSEAPSDVLAFGDLPRSIYEWTDAHFQVAFDRFISRHARSYTSMQEKQKRFGVFKANLTHIYLTNAQGYSYTLGLNRFGDWTREEFARFVKGTTPNAQALRPARLGVLPSLSSAESLPQSVDWRSKGCVTPVKDQGQCGSCWAFSTTGAVEGAWCVSKGELRSLSEQQLVDCSRSEGNSGCDGGLMDLGFGFIQTHGICDEKEYPYEAKDGKCRDTRCRKVVKIDGFYDVPKKNEKAMKAALAHYGPVSIAIQADQLDFQFYKSGIFDAPCGNSLDHGVLLVGFGSDLKTKKDFFIMKNSWGAEWGDQGYMYMAQHKGEEGQCGLLLSASFPLTGGEQPPPPEPHS